MFESVAKIITAVGTNSKKMLVMSIVLFFISGVAITSKILTKSDCSPLIKQNEELVIQSQQLITANSKLLGGYLKLQELVGGLTPDTVFITKTITSRPTVNDIQLLARVTSQYSDGDSVEVLKSQNIEINNIIPTKVKIVKSYKPTNTVVLDNITNIINSNIKK